MRLASASLLTLLLAVAVHADITIQVDANGHDRVNSPVTIELNVPDQISAEQAVAWKGSQMVLNPGNIAVQVEPVAVTGDQAASKVNKVRIHWIEPELKAGQTKSYQVGVSKLGVARPRYVVADTDTTRDLKLGGTLIWRHDSLKHDPAKHTDTYKHFHQVYGFHDDGFITQGVGGRQFPHHRGLYMGWSKTGFNGKNYDTWHCTSGVALKHRSFIPAHETMGQVMARSVATSDWTTGDNTTILTETRAVETWSPVAGLVVLDFHFNLKAAGSDVKLDGDPQHAGFQFRAAGEVGQSKSKYIYPANVEKKGGDVWANCAWVVNQFAIKGNGYAVAHFDHPANPGTNTKQTVYSTRDYGRFGSFAKVDLKDGAPLNFKYRVLIIDTKAHPENSVEHFQKLYEGWLTPVKLK